MPLGRIIQRFLADGSGNIAIIVALVFVPMVVLAGGATDLARYETFRVALQDALDRGVLAAAALSQTQPSDVTVRDYVGDLTFISDVGLQVDDVIDSINAKKVTATATYPMPTAFLPLVGINTLNIRAMASAEDRRQNVEMSLMLDFSGSMVGSKFTRLKIAAKEFVDTILAEEARPTTSVSIVPYAGQVNVGHAMFDALANVPAFPARREHGYSSCFEINAADYASGMISFAPRPQVPVFTVWNAGNYSANLNPDWCPYEIDAISYLSNDPAVLKARIDGYQMHDGTGSGIAVNYGYMLLDPSARPMVNTAINLGLTSSQFAGRPASFTDSSTVKFIVLMTDGITTEQYTAKVKGQPPRTAGNYTLTTSTAANITRMQQVCTAAKNNHVVVFTIGFEVSGQAATEMRNCATSPSHFYQVSGLDISMAFRSIASAIQQIKLTQ